MQNTGIDIPITDKATGKQVLYALKKKQFALKHTGVASRLFNSWRETNLIPDAGEENKWAKLDFSQYLWIKIIQDLRAFGVSHSQIFALKENLFQKPGRAKIGQHLTEENAKVILDRFQMVLPNAEDLDSLPKKMMQTTNPEVVDFIENLTVFDSLVAGQIIFRSNYHIYYTIDGRFLFQSDFLQEALPNQFPKVTMPHICIPLSYYIFQFLSDKTKAEFLPNLPILSEEEKEVLRVMRNKQLREITIKYLPDGKGKKKVDIITTKDGELSEEESKKIIEALGLENYQNIILFKDNSSKLSFKRSHRKKL